MKTEGKKKFNTANHKPVSKSARLSVEKTSRCKAFAGMKTSSDSLIDLPGVQFEHLW